jgi:PEP-CTERM motif
MRPSLRSLAGTLTGAVLLMSAPAFANVVFTDSTFDLANYTASPVFTSPGITLTYDQCASCGNPGLGLQLIASFSLDSVGDAAVGLANTTFSYDPLTQGAIASINASVDKDLTDNYPFPATFGNTFHPLIEQDGNLYIASIPGPGGTTPGSTGYNTISRSGLIATDFEEYDFTTGSFVAAFPNFAGDPMLFGLAQIFSTGTAFAAYTSEADYDNLQLTIVTAVPEPGSIFLLGAGIAGLVGLRRRTRA